MRRSLARFSTWVGLGLAAASCGSTDAAPPAPPPGTPNLPVSFPAGFRLGVATVAYQSEGTIQKDAKRVHSNWSEWEDLDKIEDKQRNPRGNGFFDHYDVDLDLAASIGANAFSYAIDWARIEPQEGVFDEDEVARAVDIVTHMKQRGIRPMVVLFHWVTPAWVQSPVSGVDLLSRDDQAFVDAFLPVVDKMVPKLAGLVDDWVTFEEPISIIGGEYLTGEHPPGHVLDMDSASRALVNLMYLNARVYHRVHALDTADADGDGVSAMVGFENLSLEVVPMHSDRPKDVAAAKRIDYMANHQFLTGVYAGDIDLDMDGLAESTDTPVPEKHVDELAHTVDFIGLNYYQRCRVEAGGAFAGVKPLYATPHYDVREYDATLPHGDDYAEISASGLRVVLDEYQKYKLPLMITENGMADADDDQRPYYTLQHLYEIADAIRDGYDIRGYYHWTLSDNFEWFYGTNLKEGLFQVDFTDPSFPRKKTRSAELFSKIAKGMRIDGAVWSEYALASYPVGIH